MKRILACAVLAVLSLGAYRLGAAELPRVCPGDMYENADAPCHTAWPDSGPEIPVYASNHDALMHLRTELEVADVVIGAVVIASFAITRRRRSEPTGSKLDLPAPVA